MKKTNKLNKKRLFLSIMILIILIVAIVLIVKFAGNGEETNGNFNLGDSQENVDTPNSQEGGDTQPDQTSAVPDGTNSVPQNETESVGDFVDESGNKLEEDTLQTSKDAITQAFKAISPDKLGLEVDLNSARIMFNQGITTIAENECFVFSVYVQDGETMKNIGTYAMSRDTKVLYKFNLDTLVYDLIEI